MTGKVIHVKDMARYPDAVYIGRRNNRAGLAESIWRNPFRIGEDGTRGMVVEGYCWLITDGPKRYLLRTLPELRDKPLACWCRRDGEPRTAGNVCHGDVLLELLDTFTDDELREMAK